MSKASHPTPDKHITNHAGDCISTCPACAAIVRAQQAPPTSKKDSHEIPDMWMPLAAAHDWIWSRVASRGSNYVLEHWPCKYVNARVDMRTGAVRLSPGNDRSSDETSERCVWTRMPDDEQRWMQPVRFHLACADEIARGRYPFYPDNCPQCGKLVQMVQMVPLTGEPSPAVKAEECTCPPGRTTAHLPGCPALKANGVQK